MDGAGAHDHGEAIVLTGQDIVDVVAGSNDGAGGGIGAGMSAHHLDGGGQRLYFGDAQVVGGFEHFVGPRFL